MEYFKIKFDIDFCVVIHFHFSGRNAQKCNLLGYLVVAYLIFKEIGKLFQSDSNIPTKYEWMIQVFCIFSSI